MKEVVETRNYNGHDIVTYLHDADSKDIAIFCHGYRGDSTGPNRFFVRMARELAERGISCLRFDQYGSGNSAGDFFDSRFNDWVAVTRSIAADYLRAGYRVCLLGQSMGGSTVIVAAAQVPELSSVVAWVPDPSIEDFIWPEEKYIEEMGQRVSPEFWQEAHNANIADAYRHLQMPLYIVQCSADEYVSEENRRVFTDNAKSNCLVELYEGYPHSSWTYDQASEIIQKSIDFIVRSFVDRNF